MRVLVMVTASLLALLTGSFLVFSHQQQIRQIKERETRAASLRAEFLPVLEDVESELAAERQRERVPVYDYGIMMNEPRVGSMIEHYESMVDSIRDALEESERELTALREESLAAFIWRSYCESEDGSP